MPKTDPLARKRQYVFSLTHSARYKADEDFLTPISSKKPVTADKDCDN